MLLNRIVSKRLFLGVTALAPERSQFGTPLTMLGQN